MTTRRPLALYKGIVSEVLDGDTVRTGVTSASGIIAGSGLVGGGSISDTLRVDAALASNPSGLIFVGDSLGIDGVAEATANAGLASGNAAILVASSALASGNAALATSLEAQASGNAALFDASTVHFDLPGTQVVYETASPVVSGYALGLDDQGKVQAIRYIPSAKNRIISPITDYTLTNAYSNVIVYASTPDRYVFGYQDFTNSSYGTAIVGEWDGSSWTFATPQIFSSTYSRAISVAYDSTNNAVVFAYDSNNGFTPIGGTAVVGAFSGTTLSFGTEVLFQSGDISNSSICYDSTNQKVVIAFEDDGGSDWGRSVVGTVSGSSITFGSVVTFHRDPVRFTGIVHDSTNNKIVIAYEDNANSDYGTAVVGTVSGTSITYGTLVVFNSGSTDQLAVTFDSTNNKVVIVYRDLSASAFGNASVGTVSGTSISFGTKVTFSTDQITYPVVAYDNTYGVLQCSFFQLSDPYYVIGAVSGTVVNFEDPQSVTTDNGDYGGITYNSSRTEFVTVYRNNTTLSSQVYVSSIGASGILPKLNSQSNFIGIAQSTVASGSDCLVNLPGGIYNETAANLTTASFYYVDPLSSGVTTSTTEAITWSGQVPWNYIGKAVSSSGLMLLKSI